MTPASSVPSDAHNGGEVATSRATGPVIPDYQLIRLIGQGSYGDVWLARGLTGVYRAIKIVWRNRFPDALPYEREFKGLKKFMGMSLGESSQLALLHVGQNQDAGFFYYVMELADDADPGRSFDPATYKPLTLREVRLRRGRLPAADCINLGVGLTRGLADLHARGLVHRDIKPSNVILVSGLPKLADVGLVADVSDSLSYVGTEGYVPPEGPGKASADVYALGRLLYELATGLDRQEFPQLPPQSNKLPDRKLLFELNEVILRACDPTEEQRYVDAGAMLQDLLVLQAGSSVRLRRTKFTLVAAGMIAIAIAGFFLWPKSRSDPAPPLAPPSPPALAALPTPVAPPKSIAVLPFSNFSDDKENGYLADGLQDDVVTDLAGLRELKVVSRASAMHYRNTTKTMKEVGLELGVAYILNGSIRREGNHIRVTTQLVDARTDQEVWARKFDREVAGILAVQSDIAGELIPALQLALSPTEMAALTKEPTSSAPAYQLFQEARDLENHTDEEGYAERAEAKLRQAVAEDPGFMRAWVELAAVHRGRYWSEPAERTPARVALAEQAIETARRLAPDAPEVLLGLGQIRQYCYRDYDGAIAIYRQILERFPNYPDAHLYLGYLYRRQGRWPETLAEFHAATLAEPGSLDKADNYSGILIFARRYDEVVQQKQLMLKFWPENIEARFGMALASFVHFGYSEAVLESWYATVPASERETAEVIALRFGWALHTGNEALLLDLIRRHGLNLSRIDGAIMLRQRGERELLQAQLDRWKPELDRRLKTAPLVAGNWLLAAKYHALRGEKAEALAAIDRARQIPPDNNDVINPFGQSVEIAKVLAWLGEKDAAFAEIGRLINKVPATVHTWQLARSMGWLPLRGDPRLDAIIQDPVNNRPLF